MKLRNVTTLLLEIWYEQMIQLFARQEVVTKMIQILEKTHCKLKYTRTTIVPHIQFQFFNIEYYQFHKTES